MERTWTRGKPAMMLGIVLVLLMLVVAACGEEDESLGSGGNTPPTPTPTQSPSSTPTPDTIDHPQDADDVVVKIEHVGGFVMQETIVTRMPHFVLLGDGTVITQGPQIAIFPPPALPNLQAATLNEEGIQMILKAAEEAGLLDGDKDFKLPMIADAATTVFTITADGKTHTVSVYALGADEFASDTLPEDEVEARQKIAEFEAMVLDYIGWLPEDTIDAAQSEFPMEQLQVVAIPRDLYPVMDETVDTGEMDWPLETPLAEIGEEYTFMDEARCVVIEGEELDTLVEALGDANQQTTWISDDGEFGLLLRPVLPGETGCSLPQM